MGGFRCLDWDSIMKITIPWIDRIRLTCLHPCCHPNSDHVMIPLGGYNCSVLHSSMRSVECDNFYNCNHPKESSHNLNWNPSIVKSAPKNFT